MVDKTTETEEPQETPEHEEEEHDAEGSRILSLDAINDKLDDLAAKIAGLGRRPRSAPADQGADVAAQVRAEVGKIKAAEDRTKAREDRLGSLEARVKEIAEKAPVEYRRITKLLWGDYEK